VGIPSYNTKTRKSTWHGGSDRRYKKKPRVEHATRKRPENGGLESSPLNKIGAHREESYKVQRSFSQLFREYLPGGGQAKGIHPKEPNDGIQSSKIRTRTRRGPRVGVRATENSCTLRGGGFGIPTTAVGVAADRGERKGPRLNNITPPV